MSNTCRSLSPGDDRLHFVFGCECNCRGNRMNLIPIGFVCKKCKHINKGKWAF